MDLEEAFERGRVTFMDLELGVARGALVPRAETELLGRTAIDVLSRMRASEARDLRVIDMCCGIGNLACAIAHHVPSAQVWASDFSSVCVETARANSAALGLRNVTVCEGDLFDPLAGLGLEGAIDAIVCNPPYISEKRLAGDAAQLLELEPREAFAAGPYGLGIHMRVVRDALAFLKPGGALLFEVGLGQDRQVRTLFERARRYSDITIVRNDAGEGRVVLGYAAA
jgi:release factor glutamine methyltransferase